MKGTHTPILKCVPFIQKRVIVSIMCCLGLTLSYIMRNCHVLAMTEFVLAPPRHEDPNACPYPPGYNITTIHRTVEYNWSEKIQGWIHASFFYGYICTQIPGGLFAGRYGGKIVLGIGILITNLLTLITPLVIKKLEYLGFIVIRILLGLAQGIVYATLHIMAAKWIPTKERGLLGTLLFSGAHFGNLINSFCTAYILHTYKYWPLVFYFYGTLGMIWSLLFFLFIGTHPNVDNFLNDKERMILTEYNASVSGRTITTLKAPWKKIFSNLPVWASVIGLFGHDVGLFCLIIDIPKYMKAVHHLNVKKNGIMSGYIYLCILFVAFVGGFIVDFIEKRKLLSRTMNRKIFTTLASILPALGIMGSILAGCNVKVIIIFLTIGNSFMGFFYPSLKINCVDLSPNYAGIIGGMAHGFGGLSGVVVNIATGYLVPDNTIYQWNITLWLMFTLLNLTNIFYLVFASGEIQTFNSLPIENNDD